MNTEKNTVVELKGDNKTEQLKDILNKVTSLRNEEVDVIRALLDLSRGLKID